MDKPEDLSDRKSEVWVDVSMVLDVTDVPVSPSSVVKEFCDGFSCCSDSEFVEPQSFSFSQKACSLLHSCAGEKRYESTHVKNASTIWKKNDAAHAAAKFVFIVIRGAEVF